MPVITTCKSCKRDFPSALSVGSLGTWESLTVEESDETCIHCQAVNKYEKHEYRYEQSES